jgi:hypothetical protein
MSERSEPAWWAAQRPNYNFYMTLASLQTWLKPRIKTERNVVLYFLEPEAILGLVRARVRSQ